MMTTILEVQDLHKHYRLTKAVDGISFKIPEGICLGLLGPNGAGKTTTVEIIEGITTPTKGGILYRGKPRSKDFAQIAGIQFQSTALLDFLTVRETLELFKSFYPRTIEIDQLIDLCELNDFCHQYATKISGGQKQRLLLSLALINNPEIVFLDEPTTGLDPQSRRHFWDVIKKIKKQGKTIILTTHYMDEAEYLCDQLLIIDHGKIISQGTPDDLMTKHFDYISVCLEHNDIDTKKITMLQFQHQEDVSIEEDVITIKTKALEQTIQTLIAEKVDLRSLQVKPPTLEDLFLKLTGNCLRD